MCTENRAGWPSEPVRTNRRSAVLLPGGGSDEVFVTAAFARPLEAVGLRLVAPRPHPGGAVVTGYREELDRAVGSGSGSGSDSDSVTGPPFARTPDAGALVAGLLVGGMSLGATIAVRWAAERAARGLPGPAGLLLALPAWTGESGEAPAAVAARATAAALRHDGLGPILDEVRANTPAWLGTELARAWARHGDSLAEAFDTTAGTPGPTPEQLAELRIPVGIVGLLDDPVHPIEVARHWRAQLPHAALVTTTLTAIGHDRETLGRAAMLAWSRAAQYPAGSST